ncbi:hypothetical protein QBC38DRAFT_516622 [Podospora fimiseda]|uniref:F-box domain-containing protein n=1 Tax=Podospora fimiseda TaxID=252190 RepID=A0AAN7GSJ0_9PEZI|nr:hypothetical protein QBC38DRAFT_516622 [Podospora fimiseda]
MLERRRRPQPVLSEIPTGLHMIIFSYLDCRDLAVFARTSKILNEVAMDILYRISLTRQPCLLFWAARFGRVNTIKRLLAVDKNLFDLVMSWKHQSDAYNTWPQCGERPRTLSQATLSQGTLNTFRRFTGYRYDFLYWKNHDELEENNTCTFCSAIYLAVEYNQVEVVNMIVTHSPAVIQQRSLGFGSFYSDLNKYTYPGLPLHVALDPDKVRTRSSNVNIVRLLLDSYRNVQPQDNISPNSVYGCTLLNMAYPAGNVELVKLCLEYDDTFWSRVPKPPSNHFNALSLRANIDHDIGHRYTPLIHYYAVRYWHGAIEVVQRGANVNTVCHAKPSLLALSLWTLESSADARRCGLRAIDLACTKFRSEPSDEIPHFGTLLINPDDETKRCQLVRTLIDAGADVGPSGFYNRPTPIIAATKATFMLLPMF